MSVADIIAAHIRMPDASAWRNSNWLRECAYYISMLRVECVQTEIDPSAERERERERVV